MEQGEDVLLCSHPLDLNLTRPLQFLNTRRQEALSPLETTNKIVVFGGGSFGTALGAALANQKKTMEVVLLLRDQGLCDDINLSR